MHVGFPPEHYQQCPASRPVDQGICGFQTRLSHRALPRTTAILASATEILAVQVEAVQGKQDPLEWTETSGGLLEWWHDP